MRPMARVSAAGARVRSGKPVRARVPARLPSRKRRVGSFPAPCGRRGFRALLRMQGRRGAPMPGGRQGARGRASAEVACGNAAMRFAARCCVPGRYWAVWRRSCVLAGCCRPRCAMGCLSGLRATYGGHAHGVLGRLVPSRSACWLHGGLGVRYGIVPGGGLRRSLRHHVDRLDGRFAYAAVLAFGLGAGCRRKGMVTGTSCTRYPPSCTTKR